MDKVERLQELKEEHKKEVMKVLQDTEIPEILENAREIMEYKEELEDAEDEVGEELRKSLYIMLPRKKDTVTEENWRSTVGLTFKKGTIYKYNKKESRYNKAGISRILDFKDDIIDLYREDRKRKEVSEMLNKAEEFNKARIEKIKQKNLEIGEYQKIVIKPTSYTLETGGEICFYKKDKYAPSITEELSEEKTIQPVFINHLEEFIRYDKTIKSTITKLKQDMRKKTELKDIAIERIDEISKPYRVTEAL